jgi:hypothetical protein
LCNERDVVLSQHLQLCGSMDQKLLLIDKDRCAQCHDRGARQQCYRCVVVWTCGSEKCKESHKTVCMGIILTPFYKSEFYRQVHSIYEHMMSEGSMPKTPMSIVFVGFQFHLLALDTTAVRALTVESIVEYDDSEEFVRAFIDESYARQFLDDRGMIKDRYRCLRFFMYKEDGYSIRIALNMNKMKYQW